MIDKLRALVAKLEAALAAEAHALAADAKELVEHVEAMFGGQDSQDTAEAATTDSQASTDVYAPASALATEAKPAGDSDTSASTASTR